MHINSSFFVAAVALAQGITALPIGSVCVNSFSVKIIVSLSFSSLSQMTGDRLTQFLPFFLILPTLLDVILN